jgi:hypothetical protein
MVAYLRLHTQLGMVSSLRPTLRPRLFPLSCTSQRRCSLLLVAAIVGAIGGRAPMKSRLATGLPSGRAARYQWLPWRERSSSACGASCCGEDGGGAGEGEDGMTAGMLPAAIPRNVWACPRYICRACVMAMPVVQMGADECRTCGRTRQRHVALVYWYPPGCASFACVPISGSALARVPAAMRAEGSGQRRSPAAW